VPGDGRVILRLENARLGVTVVPSMGGGLARFDWLGGAAGPVAMMRAVEPADAVTPGGFEPNRLACYPLVPWSNRVTGGGFTQGDERIALPLNRADDDYPIHGSGWQRAWQVTKHGATSATLVVRDTIDGAYDYEASLAYALDGDALRVALRVTNAGTAPRPFGLGLHPFFPCHDSVRLHAPARTVWLNDARNLAPRIRDAVPPAWDFSTDTDLPTGGLNNGFQGWTGQARITWPREGLALDVSGDVDTYIVYVPEGEGFFCFEPVDHPVDALNLPGGATAHGMSLLAPGQALARSFAFRVSEEGYTR
jgi:aldose 1-epimerase